MPRLFAFLRAVNVGGHTVTMDRLRGLFEALGAREVETFIASGNVIFSSPARDLDALRRKIERHLLASLDYEVTTFLRTDTELAAIAQYRPFAEPRLKSAATFCVGFLADPLGAAQQQALMALKSDIDDFRLHGRELYWLCKRKQSESDFSNVVLERTVKVRATFRSANTVAKLAAKYALTP